MSIRSRCPCGRVSKACSRSYPKLEEGLCTKLQTGGPIQRDARSGTPSAEALGTGILRSQKWGKTITELHWQVLDRRIRDKIEQVEICVKMGSFRRKADKKRFA